MRQRLTQPRLRLTLPERLAYTPLHLTLLESATHATRWSKRPAPAPRMVTQAARVCS
jgi:hypothetical protein